MPTATDFSVLETLKRRLSKIGIEITLSGNYPWIYLSEINGNRVHKKYLANHGFTVAFMPNKPGAKMKITDIREVFKLIRVYKGLEKIAPPKGMRHMGYCLVSSHQYKSTYGGIKTKRLQEELEFSKKVYSTLRSVEEAALWLSRDYTNSLNHNQIKIKPLYTYL